MAPVAQGPTIARRRLSNALRAARDGSGQTQEQVAGALDWSISKMIRIENGKVKPTVTDVKALLQLYGVREIDRVDELTALARASRQRAWWAEYRDQLPQGFADYVAIEADASDLMFFQPLYIPGLFQTEAYIWDVMRNRVPEDLADADKPIRVRVRQLRQQHLLSGPRRPKIDAVIDESALRRVASNPAVMRDQLLHLAGLGNDPLITLRVLPFEAGVAVAMSSFIIVRFPGDDPDVVYYESGIAHTAMLDRSDPAPYWSAYNKLVASAMSPTDSLTFIAKVASEYR
ncbi:helix-turn-helix domain-containing protein [Hamadaea tsunoensis]|uniref:helix-turn-helix domain-containing protein n=1 Tax=Hamadaea tsunoensis TaxID=53368 RepID=UPI000488F2D1|nr:helix-turn-helix transcriptional regulator [Hamadaea tsunoensis]